MTSFCCGFECGRIAGSGAGTGEHWTSIGSVPATIVATGARSGSRALRLHTTSHASCVASLNLPLSGFTPVVRFYVKLDAIPVAMGPPYLVGLAALRSGSGGTYGALVYDIPTQSIRLWDASSGTLGTTPAAVATGQYVACDLAVDMANGGLIRGRVAGVDLGTLSHNWATHPVALLHFGDGNAVQDTLIDDVSVSLEAGDYPLGPASVLPFVPVSDGVHHAPAGVFKRGVSGQAITNATADSYALVDDLPLPDSTQPAPNDCVAQVNKDASAYVEHRFAPVVTAPRGVEVIAGVHRAAARASNSTLKMSDGVTDDVVFVSAGTGFPSITFGRKHYGPLTVAGFNALRSRFGYSTDANPAQCLDSVLIEAEFPE